MKEILFAFVHFMLHYRSPVTRNISILYLYLPVILLVINFGTNNVRCYSENK